MYACNNRKVILYIIVWWMSSKKGYHPVTFYQNKGCALDIYIEVSVFTTLTYYSFGGTTGSFLVDNRVAQGGGVTWLTVDIAFGSTAVVAGDVDVLLIVDVSTVLLRLPAKHNASLRICCCKSRRSRNKPEANIFYIIGWLMNRESLDRNFLCVF